MVFDWLNVPIGCHTTLHTIFQQHLSQWLLDESVANSNQEARWSCNCHGDIALAMFVEVVVRAVPATTGRTSAEFKLVNLVLSSKRG